MRKARKKQAEDFIKLLEQAHLQIKKDMEAGRGTAAMDLLAQCQEGAVQLGNMIEHEEGEGTAVISLLQDYCEQLYQIYENLQQNLDINTNKTYKELKKALIQIENTVKHQIKARTEVVFLPYKASMWDSMESVWMAAEADPDCDAYVIPIPYYERTSDGNFGTCHYEGNDFPTYVPITPFREYNLADRRPDVIYIHNPYDQDNYVTSVDPAYYSDRLKKYTDCLVYIPYYAAAGGMSEGQALCQSYFNVDYIVVQSREIIGFFDPRVPREKFLPLGSPKFDRVIRLCGNPPEPSSEWKKKMEGRKVYFYNTSLGGMLGDTDSFIKKMEYVFRTFENRENACLLWRPHPLLESTFESMRSSYYSRYEELKRYFIENDLGIYDDTPDITKTIALCDAYVGDTGTSVTSLFGIAGKPLFILDNHIHSAPEPEDWRGRIVNGFHVIGGDEWLITQGNNLYHSSGGSYRYEYYCSLSAYSGGDYYLRALEVGGTLYVCPRNAQDILVIKGRSIVKRIPLERCVEKWGAFLDVCNIGRYLFLIPDQYPAIVRYDVVQDKIDYITGYENIFVGYADGQRRTGGVCVWKNYLMLASPVDSRILAIEADTKEAQLLDTGSKICSGYLGMIADGTDMWMSPFAGTTLTRWNPETGQLWEYSRVPEGFKCKNPLYGYECDEYPFGVAAFCGDLVYLSPSWGNMFLCVNKNTGETREWKPPFSISEEGKNSYYSSGSPGYFMYRSDSLKRGIYRFFSQTDSRLYDINLKTGEFKEIRVEFDLEEVRNQEPGFAENSEWFPYGCEENYFNTLENFLDGNVTGNSFDRERQLHGYQKIGVNLDGTCGEKIHQFMCGKNK